MTEVNLTTSYLKKPIFFLAFGFGAGYTPKLPGTMGTLVGVLLYLPLHYLHWIYYLLVVLILFTFGVWLCSRASIALGIQDHPAIVWDEIVGYLLTMTVAPVGWVWIALGFCLFRLFDIWKPWPIRWVDQYVQGGFGIMLDDVLAAIYSLIIIQIIAFLLLS